MKFKIRAKLIIAFFAVIFPFIAIVSAIAIYNTNAIRNISLKENAIAEEMQLVLSLQLAIDKSLMPGNDYIITGDKKYINDFIDASRNVEDLLKKVEVILVRLKGMEAPKIKEETEILKSFRPSWQNIKEHSQRIFEIQNPIGNKEAARLMEEMDYKYAYPLIKLLDKHHEIDSEEHAEAVDELQSVWKVAGRIMIGGTVTLTTFGVFLALFFSRLFTRPIQAIHTRADAITKGELKTRLDIKTDDEFEQLANAMNEMAAQLDSLYSSLEQKVEERTRELKESEERLRNLTETTSDWVWEVNENGVFTYSSPQIREIIGYKAKEVLGKTIFDFMRPEEAGRVAEFFRAMAAPQKPFKFFENLTVHKDGHEVVIETSGVPYFSAEGKFRGYHGINRDITERKQADEKTKEHLSYLERFRKVALKREFRIKELTTEIEKLKAEIEELKKRDIHGGMRHAGFEALRRPDIAEQMPGPS